MSRKKQTDVAVDPPPPAASPPAEPASDTNGATAEAERRPVKVFSYFVGRETWVQASVWDRAVSLADGSGFTAYDISLRKRYKERESGEWQSLYSFHSSEVYAVVHALTQAVAWVLETRAAANGCPF